MFNLRSLDLNLLTVFEAIYELGSVSGAADRLALSQSATSHALSRLERRVATTSSSVPGRACLRRRPPGQCILPSARRSKRFAEACRRPAVSIPPAPGDGSASASRIPWGRSMRSLYEPRQVPSLPASPSFSTPSPCPSIWRTNSAMAPPTWPSTGCRSHPTRS